MSVTMIYIQPPFLSVSPLEFVQCLVQVPIIWYHVNKLVSKGEREDLSWKKKTEKAWGGNKTSESH